MVFVNPYNIPNQETVSIKHWSSALPAAKNASSIRQDCCSSTQGLLALPPWSPGLAATPSLEWSNSFIIHPQDQASPALWAEKRPCQDDPASLQSGPRPRITDYHEGARTAFWPPVCFSASIVAGARSCSRQNQAAPLMLQLGNHRPSSGRSWMLGCI